MKCVSGIYENTTTLILENDKSTVEVLKLSQNGGEVYF